MLGMRQKYILRQAIVKELASEMSYDVILDNKKIYNTVGSLSPKFTAAMNFYRKKNQVFGNVKAINKCVRT